MKKIILLLIILLNSAFIFAQDFNCSFKYKVAGKNGTGNSGEGVIPVVKISKEEGTVTLPDFIFSESKTIKSFTIENVNFTDENNFSKSYFEIIQDEKNLIVKNLKGIIQDGKLKMTLNMKMGKMPFSIELKYLSE